MNREEAIKIVKSHYPANKQMLNEALEFLIPELKEDEDELTWLKNYISEEAYSLSMDIRDNEDRIKLKKLQKSLAWLEKQAESKSFWKPTEEQYEALTYAYNICSDTDRGNYYEGVLETLIEDLHRLDEQHPKFKVGDIVQYITDSTDRRKIEEVDTFCNMYHTDSSPIMFEIEDEWKVVVNAEDVEQTPTDKVEPKFKVGDWIIQEYVGVYKVIEICKSWYEVIDDEDNHYSISFDKEGMCHLWTINDAKPGDIIYAESKFNTFDFIAIFSEIKNKNSWEYCSVDSDSDDYSDDLDHWEFDDHKGFVALDRYNFYPATKKQRHLLYQKMEEAGYEWDSEQKQLITLDHFEDNDDMVEPNPYTGTSFVYNNHTWGMCARDGGVDILCDSKLIKHIDEQKPDERKEFEFVLVPFGTDIKLEKDTIIIPDGCVAIIEGNRIRIKKEGKGALEAPECMYNLNEK